MNPKKTICYIATVPAAVYAFLQPHIWKSSSRYAITVVCNPVDEALLENLPIRLVTMPIKRKPSPLHDLMLLVKLCALFSRERFDIVHSIMPKTGLVAMLAARLSGMPVRIHTFTGQVWATRRGAKRRLLKMFDWTTAHLATTVIADGKSQLDYLVDERVVPRHKGLVVGAGSICGVDVERYRPNPTVRAEVRSKLGINQEAQLLLFVGRLTRDKGIWDLIHAFQRLAEDHPRVELLLVGSEEDIRFRDICERFPGLRSRLRYVPFTKHPERYMAASDIYCLPSYREGFPLTVIEAGACALPTVASAIYGIKDTTVNGVTGILVPPGDAAALAKAIAQLVSSRVLSQTMGNAARDRVDRLFRSESITNEMLSLYDFLTGGSGKQPGPAPNASMRGDGAI